MQFFKQHYEKVLLAVVLLGLAVAAAWLPINVSSVRESLKQATEVRRNPKVDRLPPLDLSTNLEALNLVKAPPKLDLAGLGHNIFNPIPWKKGPSGFLIPIPDRALSELTVTNISPLYLKLDYQSVRATGDNLQYQVQITREAATNATRRSAMLRYLSLDTKVEGVSLKEIKGPKDNPTALVVELQDAKGTFTVTKEEPLRLVMGFTADLRYEPEKRSFPRQRVGQKLVLGGASYNIVAIRETDVTLEDSRKKRTTIRLNAGQ